MKTNQNLSILFWLNRQRMRNNEGIIYCRITINGQRAEISLQRYVNPALWNAKASRVTGRSEQAKTINAYLDLVKGELQKKCHHLIAQGRTVTAEVLKNEYLGNQNYRKTLQDIFTYHNQKMHEKAKGGKCSPKTALRFDITFSKVQTFLKDQYRLSDKPLDEIKFSFISEFEHYLTTKQKLGSNTAMKYVKNLKKVAALAVSLEWISANPFQRFKCSYENPERDILMQEELDILYTKDFATKRLEEVRDVFLFCCYTGFAYGEVVDFPNDAVMIGLDGEKWLSARRKKTSTKESVLLLPIALEIIEKYRDHPYCKMHDKLLPVNSNQRYNGYLKEIAAICHINKRLTTHTARHTFATTVTLSNGVPIETVSAMLGHRNLRTTQIYAKIVQEKVSSDMKALKQKLSQKEQSHLPRQNNS